MARFRPSAPGLICAAALLLALSSVTRAADKAPGLLKFSAPSAAAQPATDLLSAGCGGGIVAQGWTVTLIRDGTLSQSTYGPGHMNDPAQTATAPAKHVKALFKRAAMLTAAAMPHAGGSIGCALAVTLNGQALNGRFPHTLGTQAPPPNPKPAEKLFLDLVALAKATFGTAQ